MSSRSASSSYGIARKEALVDDGDDSISRNGFESAGVDNESSPSKSMSDLILNFVNLLPSWANIFIPGTVLDGFCSNGKSDGLLRTLCRTEDVWPVANGLITTASDFPFLSVVGNDEEALDFPWCCSAMTMWPLSPTRPGILKDASLRAHRVVRENAFLLSVTTQNFPNSNDNADGLSDPLNSVKSTEFSGSLK